jgi:prepilin-type N-terminal cleavage/methylation domain-containing protein
MTRRDNGQTLLEMLVALAITAMVSLLAFPALENGIAALSFRRAAHLMGSNLAGAHAAAIAGQAPVFVTLSRDGRSLGRQGGPTLRAPDGMGFTSTPPTIGFFPDGSSTGGALALRGEGRKAAFTIDPVTGNLSAGTR